jgi:DNA-binding transcriptional regulator YiaG
MLRRSSTPAGSVPGGLGALLQARREARGYSRTRLADAVGIAAGTLEGWELGRVAKPPIHDVLKVARFLGIALDEIETAVLAPAEAEPAPAAPPDDTALLERAIDLLGWSEQAAASALGVPRARVRAWRRGTEQMPLPALFTLVALLGLRAADEAGLEGIGALVRALDAPAPRR